MAYGFYFDNARCTGCKTCQMACKDYHDLAPEMTFRTVYDYEGGTWEDAGDGTFTTDTFAYHVSVACNHCDMPACMAQCPQGAISKDEKTGLVTRDEEKCIGCGTCAKACPYGAPKVDEDAKKSVKCDACESRVAAGLAPVCVEACPLRALEFGEVDELKSAHPDAVAGIAPLPDPSITTPNLLINACPAAKEPGDETGMIANEKEVTGVPAGE